MTTRKTQPERIIVKAGPDFRAWLAELVATQRMPQSTVIEHALLEYATTRKFRPPPSRRQAARGATC